MEIILTGASGFLGHELVKRAAMVVPKARVISVPSRKVPEGFDLTKPEVSTELAHRICIDHPPAAVLIHCAANINFLSLAGLNDNAAMAYNLAVWAKNVGVGFSLIVSSVSVYPPQAWTKVDSLCQPGTLYGVGKLAAEQVWRVMLPSDQVAVARLAGVWGWQPHSTLFWNRLLLAAAQGDRSSSLIDTQNPAMSRNYISVTDAADCLLRLAEARTPGTFLAAGCDTVSLRRFVNEVAALPESRLAVRWTESDHVDDMIFEPSPEVIPSLRPFSENLEAMWTERPAWLIGTSLEFLESD